MAASTTTYKTQLQVPYVLAGAMDEPRLKALVSSGTLEMKTFQEAYPDRQGIRPGARVHIPMVGNPPAFARVNTGSTSARSFTAAVADDQQMPVLRDSSDLSYTRYDQLMADISGLGGFKGSFERRIGNAMAARIMQVIGKILYGAMQSTDISPTRVYDKTGYRIRVPDLLKAKALAGDQSDQYKVLIAHSQVINGLLYDFDSVKYNPLTAASIVAGEFASPIAGFDYIIPSDQLPANTAGSHSAGDEIYSSFILRGSKSNSGLEGSMFYGFQSEMEIIDFEYPLSEMPTHYLRAMLDYVLCPRGMKFDSSTDNPTDANLADYTKWTTATQDQRNISAVMILSGGINATVTS